MLSVDETRCRPWSSPCAGALQIRGSVRVDDPTHLIASLMDDLSRRRIEVDMIKFSGPAFAKVDNRLMSLQIGRAHV